MLNAFLKQVNEYKEFILLVATLVGGLFFVRDYFATKQEVKVLQCQAENGIVVLETRINAEKLTAQILGLKKQVGDNEYAKQLVTPGNIDQTKGFLNTINTLNQDIKKLDKDLEYQQEKQRRAEDTLKPGVCERAAVQK